MQILTPPDLVWWEDPTTAQQETDDLELGPRVHHCVDVTWSYVAGVGWVAQ
jgi:hypothetical protein